MDRSTGRLRRRFALGGRASLPLESSFTLCVAECAQLYPATVDRNPYRRFATDFAGHAPHAVPARPAVALAARIHAAGFLAGRLDLTQAEAGWGLLNF